MSYLEQYDIFVSCEKDDVAQIRLFVMALEAEGWTVFWGDGTGYGPGGDPFRLRVLRSASVVVVVWSEHSIHSELVRVEAEEALARGALIPTRIDPVEAPLGLNRMQAANLVEWMDANREGRARRLPEDLKTAIQRKILRSRSEPRKPVAQETPEASPTRSSRPASSTGNKSESARLVPANPGGSISSTLQEAPSAKAAQETSATGNNEAADLDQRAPVDSDKGMLHTPQGASIFISYRREDQAAFSARIHDWLSRFFEPSRLFFDVDDIPAGVDFADFIDEKVGQCEVVLVIIGGQWRGSRDQSGRFRIEDDHDFVRTEVAAALKKGKRVVPVLLGNTPMLKATDLPPSLKPLARRQAVRITHERFKADFEGLVRALQLKVEGE